MTVLVPDLLTLLSVWIVARSLLRAPAGASRPGPNQPPPTGTGSPNLPDKTAEARKFS